MAVGNKDRVYLSLGSNVGDRKRNIADALERLAASGVKVVKTSSLYETAPWGRTDQGDFLNLVAEVRTKLDPEGLLKALKTVEERMGRAAVKAAKADRWGPRVIDLDIVLYGGVVFTGEDLQVPHPRFRERRFVLEPLAEIAPGAVDPVTGKTAEALLAECTDSGKVNRLEGP